MHGQGRQGVKNGNTRVEFDNIDTNNKAESKSTNTDNGFQYTLRGKRNVEHVNSGGVHFRPKK